MKKDNKELLIYCKKCLRKNRKEYDDNRNKTIKMYTNEFSLIEGYINYSFNVGHYLDSLITEPEKPFLQFALLRIHEQSCKIYHEATLLLENGSASGAMARWRTLFEFSVIAAVLVKYPDLAKKYIYYSKVSDYKYVKKIHDYKDQLNLKYYNMDAFSDIEKEYKEVIAKYGWTGKNPYEWAINEDIKAANLFELSKAVGREHMYAYVDEAHMYNHPSPRYLMHDLGKTPTQSKDHNRYLFSPFELELPMQLIVISLHEVNYSCIIGYANVKTADMVVLASFIESNHEYPKTLISMLTDRYGTDKI